MSKLLRRFRSSRLVVVGGACSVGCMLVACSGPASEPDAAEAPGSVRQALTSSGVFINEIHYDNIGTDAGEAVEVAGPAGTDLTGYSLVFYNGANGAVYQTTNLSGVIADQDGGFGTLGFTYPSNGIQNGSPDAVALVGSAGVVQFLSYEGTFVAVGGPANGLTSSDIGIEQTGTTPVGSSLGLVGSGSSYEDFSWAVLSSASFGAVNAGQDFSGVAADQPPALTETSPAHEATQVPVDANITLSFSEAVDVSDGWFSIVCSESGAHSAVVSSGAQSFVLDVDSDFAEAEACTVSIVAAQVTDQDAAPQPLSSDVSFSFITATSAACGAPAFPIHTLQGSSDASPFVGFETTIEGVVTGDFQGSSGLSGFYVQEEADDTDADAMTSEGVFVFQGAGGVAVQPGDVVRVSGSVSEFFGLTELSAVSEVTLCGSGAAVAPMDLSLPVDALTRLESLEGMLVKFPQVLVATENFNQGRFGEVLLANQRLYQPTHVAEPGAAAQDVQAGNDRAQILLDDASNVEDPEPVPYLGAEQTLRLGDTLSDLTGVMSFAFSVYRVQPTAPVEFQRADQRLPAPSNPGGSLKVASFNVLNYFTSIDDGNDSCGPNGSLECRGADSPEEFSRQRAKTIEALGALNADVVGLLEIENNTSAAVQDLVDGLNAELGANTYAFVDTGTIGTDAIKVALIYKPASVALVGDYAVLDSSVDPAFIDTLNRPVLAQTFAQQTNGEVFTVAVNHLKSKGSACAGDPDLLDGQGNCNQTRTAAAAAEVAWLAADPTGSGDPDVLVIGDMNSYRNEDPIDALRAGGYGDLVDSFIGAAAYSYVFDGAAGYLDHALATSSLAGQVVGVREWHINADEPRILDYNQEFNPPSLYAPDAYRSSDHDPVVVSLDLGEVPTCHGLPATIYVNDAGVIVGGPRSGKRYTGVLKGSTGSDVVVGTQGLDVIQAAGGADIVCALGGDDEVLGAQGADLLDGGDGDDTLDGGAAPDVLLGGAGDDRLSSGAGDDELWGDEGDDRLIGGGGVDSLSGGAGTDVLDGGAGNDELWGDGGNDALMGGKGADILLGGEGSDTLQGDAGRDVCDGGPSSDSALSCERLNNVP